MLGCIPLREDFSVVLVNYSSPHEIQISSIRHNPSTRPRSGGVFCNIIIRFRVHGVIGSWQSALCFHRGIVQTFSAYRENIIIISSKTMTARVGK